MIFRHLKIKGSDYTHGYTRGVYYSTFYENSLDFFNEKINEDELIEKKKFSDDQLMIDWWKAKAIERYSKLHDDGKLLPDVLYYNKMIGMDYESAKQQYFGRVGLNFEPYSIHWDKSNYKLYYNDMEIAEGMIPPEIIIEFVRLMNCAYKNGFNLGNDYGYSRGLSNQTTIQTEFDFGDT